MESILIILLIIVGFSFLGGLFDGAEAAASGCGKVIGYIIVAGLICLWIFGLL